MTPPPTCQPDPSAINDEAPDDSRGPVRRCVVTGQKLPRARLIRFVVGPDDGLVPDLKSVLPGRGFSLCADRETVETALTRKLFQKAAARAGFAGRLVVPEDLPGLIECLLARRLLDILGLARRAGQVVAGFDKVDELLRRQPIAALVAAADGAQDGRKKLKALAWSRTGAEDVAMVESLTSTELSLALGRENVVHAALIPGRLAKQFLDEAQRLSGFRLLMTRPDNGAPNGLINERR